MYSGKDDRQKMNTAALLCLCLTSSLHLNHWYCTGDLPTAWQLRRRLWPDIRATDWGWMRICKAENTGDISLWIHTWSYTLISFKCLHVLLMYLPLCPASKCPDMSHKQPFKLKIQHNLLWMTYSITSLRWCRCTWGFKALQGLRVSQRLEVVHQVTCSAASVSHQPQQHAAWAALQLQHLQGAHLHVVRAGEWQHIIFQMLQSKPKNLSVSLWCIYIKCKEHIYGT